MAFSRRKFLTLASTAAAGATALAPLEAFCARVANGQTARELATGHYRLSCRPMQTN